MLKRLKEKMLSDEGMRIVNILYALSLIVLNPIFIICTSILWIAYLVHAFRGTKDRVMRTVFGLLCLCGAAIIAFSVYSLVRGV